MLCPHTGSGVLRFRCTGDVLVRLLSTILSFPPCHGWLLGITSHHFGSASHFPFLSVGLRLATPAQWMGRAVP